MLGEKSQRAVSRIAQGLDQAVREHHQRKLKDRYRYRFFDGVTLRRANGRNLQLIVFTVFHHLNLQ